MCGIAGLYGPDRSPPRQDELEAMVAALHHRGPDGQGIRIDGPVGLGHARLSIIDLEGGAQPLHNEDGSIWVVFNGEIFNYVELREVLVRQGHRFHTRSDTEVLVHLYEQHGDDFVQQLNGQFALALWDGRRRRLVLARDRVGIRPLFYTWAGGRLAFASEVKALFTLPEVPRKLDPGAIASTFSYWSALPPASVFEGVSVLPPGHLMTVEGGRAQVRRYWDWAFPGHAAGEARSEEDCAEQLHALLVDAVRLQLRADVPVGAYLSGGLDSSVITAIIHNHTRTPLRSFSLTFEDAEFDESAHQRALVAHLRTDHTSMQATKGEIGSAFPRMVWHAEAPVVRTAPVPMMLLADSVREAGYKVVLTGEGADEAFGGYDLFKEAKVRRFAARTPQSRWRPRLLERLYPYLANSPAAGQAFTRQFFGTGAEAPDAPHFAHMTRLATTRRILGFFAEDWRPRVQAWDPHRALADGLPPEFDGWAPLERDQYVEAHTLMSGYLLSSQGDRMAMAASIEARYPFLDHRVIEFACRLPPRFKLRGLNEKMLLKKAMRHELPASIGQRTKQPYRAPDSACFFSGGRPLPYVEELLSPASLGRAGLFDPGAVGKLVEKCRAGRAIGFGDNMAFVGVLSTMLLHEQFIRPSMGAVPWC
ncbi:asparagine synthase (glutamine-hydrolyzing) [Piscinibacter sp. XHJ-5]|uniref:asparagine synthase (glutamine-hydrolyzing) n=1 Tax=Piscinibacter sp. XHJ-5 TaxID=3037797 RepID=UPI0024536BBC|nr:asparagine synthase (glutamine-hydrolyzing) [Piscinibacter sp. XHJ-5]